MKKIPEIVLKHPYKKGERRITRLKGKTKMTIENEKALKIIRAYKGMFG